MAVSMIGILILAGAVLGVLALVVFILTNKQTRLFGAIGLALLFMAGMLLFTYSIASSAYQAEQRVKQEFQEVQDARRAVEKARLANELKRLTSPKINLSDASEPADPGAEAGVPLTVVTSPPAWGERPQSDYEPDSDFAKQIAAERDADFILIKRPQIKKGLEQCLALERAVMLDAARRYVNNRSETKIADNAPLGMSAVEIYKRFVKERQLIEKDGKHTIYTMFVVKNKEGGDELLAKTLALAEDNSDPVPSADRPAWVDNPPKRAGGVFTTVVRVGPYSQLDECYEETDRQLADLAYDYLKSNAPASVDGHKNARSAWFFGMTNSSLRELLYRDEFVEPVESSVGDMQNLYTLVEITPEDGERIRKSREKHIRVTLRDERVTIVTIFAGGILGLVALVFGLLKLDEATRGYYSKWLLLGVPVGILLLMVILLEEFHVIKL